MGKRKKGHDYRTVEVDEQSSDCELQLATSEQILAEFARRNVAFVLGWAYVESPDSIHFKVATVGTEGLIDDIVERIIETT